MLLKICTMVTCCLLVTTLWSQDDLFVRDMEQRLEAYRTHVVEDNRFYYDVALGVKVDLGWIRNGSVRAFAAVGFLRNFPHGAFKFLVGGQSVIEFYRGGLGTSLLNAEKFKINVELRHSIMILSGWENGKGGLAGKPAFVNVGNNRSALYDPLDVSISLGTTFINGINHSRHQRIGFGSFSIFNLLFQYYNDATPFDIIGLADGYDRYWTGGGQLGYYWKDNHRFFTDLVLRFDNYTGYQLNLYEVASKLNIDQLPYKDKSQQMFNQANFQYKVGIRNTLFLNLSIYEPVFADIQNLIHYRISKSPFHARPLSKRYAFGIDYQYDLTLRHD